MADDAYPDTTIAAEAVRRLRAARESPGQPFFMAVGFLKPHLPFCAPKRYWDLYERRAFKLPGRTSPPDGAPAYAPQFGGELRQYAEIPERGALNENLQRTLIHGYHAAVSYMDAQLGRVIAALDESGLAPSTIIVLWGDHGWHLGDHGMWCKHTNYEQATRIPLIVAAPGSSAAGADSAALIETVDLYPTLCELAGIPLPAGIDGRSFAAVVRDPAREHRDHATHVYPRGERLGRAIRTARHRLVEWKEPGSPDATAELELYDYEIDSEETVNLAGTQPQVVARLRRLLAQQPEARPQVRSIAAQANPNSDRAALFASKDSDADGKLTREEFMAGQPDPASAADRFNRFDTTTDGVLSREEFINRGKPAP